MAVQSYNGWRASRDPKAIDINQSWEPIPGHRFPGGVKAGDVETVMTYLVRQLDARVEPIELYKSGDEWGWFFKQSANSPDLVSCHSSGTAIDYNATKHPNGKRGTWTRTQVAEVRRILEELGGVVRWLYDAKHTPDEMHFEIRGTPAQVAVVARNLQPFPTPIPKPSEEDDVALIIQKTTGPRRLMAVTATHHRHVNDQDELNRLLYTGLARMDPKTKKPYEGAIYDQLLVDTEPA